VSAVVLQDRLSISGKQRWRRRCCPGRTSVRLLTSARVQRRIAVVDVADVDREQLCTNAIAAVPRHVQVSPEQPINEDHEYTLSERLRMADRLSRMNASRPN